MSFDPQTVERHNPMYANEVSGPYVDAEDYDQLLTLYTKLADELYVWHLTLTRAIAEGHDVAWIKAEIEGRQECV